MAEEDAAYAHLLHRQGKGLQSVRVSPHRPGHGYGGTQEGRVTTWEVPFAKWCEESCSPRLQLRRALATREFFLDLLSRFTPSPVSPALLWSTTHREFLKFLPDGSRSYFGLPKRNPMRASANIMPRRYGGRVVF